MEDEEALVAAFMDATGCGREVAFDRLARCGGHLGNAINSFFSIHASGSRSRPRSRSPPPPPPPTQAPSPAASARRKRVSRWDSETRAVVSRSSSSKSSRRRERRRRVESRRRRPSRDGGGGGVGGGGGGDGGREAAEDGNHRNGSRRRRRFREYSSSSDDGEEAATAEANNNGRRRQCRSLNPTCDSEDEKTKSGDNDSSINISSDDEEYMLEALADAARTAKQPPPRPSPSPPPPPSEDEQQFFHAPPPELTFRGGGGFHAAKAHAARRQRWLLASVQSTAAAPLPALRQNRDVWGNDLVAQCVRERFVLWQADAGDGEEGEGEELEEARKVLAYYGIPHDDGEHLPVVVVVDPVTGQAMDVLQGSAAYELNDFMVSIGPYTETKPAIPARNKQPCTAVLASAPAPTTTAVMMRKQQPDAVVAAAAVGQTRQEQAPTTTTMTVAPCCTGQQQPAESMEEEKVCKVRVRLADGRVVTKEFGSQCAVGALFAYCRSAMQLDAGGGAPPGKPFRLLRFVGRATEEIGDQSASFESMGLHLTTVSVHIG